MKKIIQILFMSLGLMGYIAAQAQTVNVSGKVSDSNGNSLPGVNVVIKGTTTGTVTNNEGSYTIENVNSSATLVFSFIGFQTKEIQVQGQSTINVDMQEDVIGLDEVVAIGYGTMKKSDLTGSVTSVKAAELVEKPSPNLAQALQGKASGVLVRTTSAAPGGGSSIIIRGINSVTSGSSPLFVVDGIPLGDISTIPTEDIQSVEVLKDASSTAIYGSRGANGVILITTKKGAAGATSITYSTHLTLETIPTSLNLMNGQEFAQFFNEWQLAVNSNLKPENVWYNGSAYDRPTPEQAGQGTDWFKEITRTGVIKTHEINISGGNDKNKYSVSLNYYNHDGLVVGGDYSRIGMKASNSFYITKWLDSGFDLFLTQSIEDSSGENTGMEGTGGVLSVATKMPTPLKIYNEEGGYQMNTLPASQTLENPVAFARELTNRWRLHRAFGNFYLNFKPVKDLNLKVSVGGDIKENKHYYYNPSITITGGLTTNGIASLGANTTNYVINENILSYNKTFDQHKLDLVGGFTYEQQVYEAFSAGAKDFITDEFLYNNLGSANDFSVKPSSNKTKWQLASLLGRANYSYDEKYLLSVSARYDGSSRFGTGNKWGFFPSVAAAWRISEEPFMQNLDWLTFMKIRGSYGETGNQNIGLYKSLATFSMANYPFGTAIQPGVYADNLENKDLKWETTTTTDLALDFGIFKKVNFTIDAYYKKTTDLLMWVSLIETSGFGSALMNVGSLENKGLEFSADARVIDRGIKWNLKGDIYLNRNKILTLNGDATQAWKIGQPLGVQRSYVIDGIIRTQADLDNYKDKDGNPINGAQLGDYKIKDLNNDGVLSGDDLDVIFNPNPKFTFSITNDISYKNLGLSIFIYGNYGNQVENLTSKYFTGLDNVRNMLSRDLLNNVWTPDNIDAKYARMGSVSYQKAMQRYIEDGSFLRLQNILLYYNLPFKKVVKTAKIYASIQNLYTLTKYTGWDPDVSSVSNNQEFGVDRASYPVPRSYTFGLNVTF